MSRQPSEAGAPTKRSAGVAAWRRGLRRRRKPPAGAPPLVGQMTVQAQIVAECQAMASYALASGRRVPATAVQSIAELGAADRGGSAARPDTQQWRRLVQAHDQLVQLVSPATPRTLLLLSEDAADGKLQMLGAVPLVRRMLIASIVLLTIFLLTALSPRVTSGSGDLFADSGLDLLVNELFLLSAAGIGAAFAALFTANHYIAEGTYDPKYEASYWVRFVLGLIAGIVLASLIPVNSGGSGGSSFTRPFLALLGGFSAAVVFRILTRLVSTLESLVQGPTSDGETAKKRLATTEASHQRIQDQMRVSAALVKLREQLASGVAPAQAAAAVDGLLEDLLPVDVTMAVLEPSDGDGAEPVASAPSGSPRL